MSSIAQQLDNVRSIYFVVAVVSVRAHSEAAAVHHHKSVVLSQRGLSYNRKLRSIIEARLVERLTKLLQALYASGGGHEFLLSAEAKIEEPAGTLSPS